MVDVRSVLSGERSSISISGRFLPEDIAAWGDVDLSSFGDIVSMKPVDVTGVLTNRAGYMRLTLDADVGYTARCARCQKLIETSLHVAIDKTVAVKGTLADEEADDIVDGYILIENGTLNVISVIIEQFALDFPMRHLCREDCRGLCPKCGKDLNEGECGCPKREIDPRLEILKTLLEDKN